MAKKDRRYMGSVKVGPKGQIVIPKEVRDIFEIEPGMALILLADEEKGIAVQRMEAFQEVADQIFTAEHQAGNVKNGDDMDTLLKKRKEVDDDV